MRLAPLLALATALSTAAAAAEEPTPGSIRQAVERSLPLLQSSAATWIAKRQCSSCHHQSLGTMAASVAAERGYTVDRSALREQLAFTLRPRRGWHTPYVTGEVSINEPIGQSYRAVGLAAAGVRPSPITDAVSYLIAGRQHAAGFWPSYSRRPPLEDSEFTATALSLRTLRLFPLGGREREFEARVDRARQWLEQAKPESTEDRAMQLLGLTWAGEGRGKLRAIASDLLGEQRADGGWAQIATRDSDVYATGQAIVALNQAAGVPMKDERLRRALAYLLRKQEPDGSWHVKTRRTFRDGLPYFETGYPHGADQFVSYAGAAWATMALALASDESVSPTLVGMPERTIDVWPATSEPDGLTPLMRTALYGTKAELEHRLGSGDDVNARAEVGGVTPLMCTVHDPDKLAALLAAGADPSATTKSGHSALLLAAHYAGAAKSVDLLLAKKVEIDRPVVEGNLPGITPLAAAVLRGDAAIAGALVTRGAQTNGVAPKKVSPLMAATLNGDAAMTRWLIARGASVTQTLSEFEIAGGTALMVAAEDGNGDVVAELIAGGAAINAKDGDGNTALVYAAMTIDRGTPEIVDRLLEAGADASVTGPHGETPAVLARRWGKPYLAERIEAKTH